jgi:hypothetical protein
MNFAEGKGPKQTKKGYATGQFVTNYGNGNNTYNVITSIGPNNTVGGTTTTVNASSVVNPATVNYPTTFSGGQVGYASVSGTTGYAVPGSVNPGLNLVSNGIDISAICSPGAQEAITDIQSITVTLNAEAGWSGTAVVGLQGTADRYTPNAYLPITSSGYNSTNWTTIATATVTTSNTPYLIKVAAASGILYNAYRLVASGGTGIIDWAIPGMFIDLSAQQVGQEAIWANGNIGQTNIQDNDVITISGGAVTGYSENALPLENIRSNHTWVQ